MDLSFHTNNTGAESAIQNLQVLGLHSVWNESPTGAEEYIQGSY